jgi:hypothetical protein
MIKSTVRMYGASLAKGQTWMVISSEAPRGDRTYIAHPGRSTPECYIGCADWLTPGTIFTVLTVYKADDLAILTPAILTEYEPGPPCQCMNLVCQSRNHTGPCPESSTFQATIEGITYTLCGTCASVFPKHAKDSLTAVTRTSKASPTTGSPPATPRVTIDLDDDPDLEEDNDDDEEPHE